MGELICKKYKKEQKRVPTDFIFDQMPRGQTGPYGHFYFSKANKGDKGYHHSLLPPVAGGKREWDRGA